MSDLLPRIERRAMWFVVGAALLALVVPPAGPPVAAGVFGGAVIGAVSYWAIKRGVTGLTNAVVEGASVRARTTRALIILVGRYALLALIAYVMIARLRLSPIGLLVGASMIPAAAMFEALATTRKNGKV
ncbi:MAG: hypothetical protein KA205_01595 [Acidobacteria bacterium]|jgi:hypothetical protein|nr:hypothetical protein [Acidobacteriota bacterium]